MINKLTIKNKDAYCYYINLRTCHLSQKPIKYFVNINESLNNKNSIFHKFETELQSGFGNKCCNTKRRLYYSRPYISCPYHLQINNKCTWFELCIYDTTGSCDMQLVMTGKINNPNQRFTKTQLQYIDSYLKGNEYIIYDRIFNIFRRSI